MLDPAPTRPPALPGDPTLLPDVDIDESQVFGSRIGFLGIDRRWLAVAAGWMILFSVGQHELPASAATTQAEEREVVLQTFATGTAIPHLTERATFGVTEYTVVQWPVNPATTSAAGFGYRDAPCGACSSYHLGVDLNPPAGTPVESIADGTVVGVNSISADLGVHVVVEHDVDGEIVRSVYAHLQRGSVPVVVGQPVGFGQSVGRVGNTGMSTGAHLHFAVIDANGTFIDPFAWLRSHVNFSWGG